MSININLKTIKAIAACAASNEEARYYLKGVLVELRPGVTRYVATDGKILVAHEETNETSIFGNWIIPLEEIKAWKILARDFGGAELSDNGDGFLKIGRDNGEARIFRPVDGTFPDYMRVLPQSVDGNMAQFDGLLLARIEKLAKEMGIGSPYLHYNGNSPCPVSFSGCEQTLAVVMPMRRDNPLMGDGYVLPQFINPATSQAKAA